MLISNAAAPSIFARAGEKLKSFFYGYYYLIYLALFTALFYCANLPVLGLCFFVVLGCVTLLCFRDLLPFMPLHLFVVMIFNDFSAFDNAWVFLLFVPIVICIVLHFIIYPIKKVFLGKLFFPLIGVSIALLLGGISSPYYQRFANGLVTTLTVGPLILLVYFIFTQYIDPPKGFDMKKYFFFMLVMICFAACVELSAHIFLKVNLRPDVWFSMGWASWNAVGAILLFAIPACWYLMLYSRHGIPFLFVLIFFYYSMYLTQSDAAGGTAFALIPVIIVTVMLRGRLKHHKYKILKTAAITFFVFLVATLTIVIAIGKMPEYVELFLLELWNDTSRTKIYKEAMGLFSKYPIFGVGSGYVNPDSFLNSYLSPVVTYNFHSTIIHVLASMGIVGVIAFIVYYVARFKIICHNSSPFNIFAYFSFIMFEIYASVDTGEFCVIPLLLCITALFIVVEKNNKLPTIEPLELKVHQFKSHI